MKAKTERLIYKLVQITSLPTFHLAKSRIPYLNYLIITPEDRTWYEELGFII